ncbi:ABC transporter ATP-binding protein [Haloprofundus sp. MHR1]|uniref:ABC transporter ATP-binding protein n=1 Tax=Haloprofundus sp. MHR1 TaxID=2572921 RepID=UPI0010BE8F6A|nr:sn-glycerol-3-phosphate ABC transporter ATP-binding protein UgpC [Haloprofundus sp. MHR1]QCJ45942.1 sn-glycerol-3-phosphate ABC transporter ATP-binding protein UgpC [Haloprofundus sp. MHR1]
MASAEYDDVYKVFDSGEDEVVAVEDLSLTVEEGEFLVLVGPSGCGKSTTLRLLAGLETISDGEIRITDEVVNDEKPKDRDIAMVFQNYALYPHKTVRENMAFGLEMTTELADSEIQTRVEEAAEMLSISELLDRRPKALSGGQKQRVALGRAIVREPTVFLMDEPLSNLDAKLRTEMRTELQQLHDKLGVATVYVTHDQTEAMTMGDRIAVLDDGQLQQLGTPLECYHEPANRFVAGFIGSPSMNFVEMEYDPTAGRGLTDGVTYQFTDGQTSVLGSRGRVTLGIRPEDVELAGESGPDTVEATVEVVEPMGREHLLHLDVGGDEVTASVSGDYDIDIGDRVRLQFPRDRIHAFDAGSGETLFNRSRQTESLPDGVKL